MARKRKAKPVGGKSARKAKRIFESLPPAARTGPVYFDVLRELGVPVAVARSIAGTWMLEHASGGSSS